MNHKQFAIEDWLDTFPLTPIRAEDSSSVVRVKWITSPIHACVLTQVREAVRDLVLWGPPTEVDMFVWALGEPPVPYLTKIGGMAYRPTNSAWPADKRGEPMTFLCQFCFADSRDIVGETPGDVLSVFSRHDDYEFRELSFEWHDISDVFDGEPHRCWPSSSHLEAIYGHICRVPVYPSGGPLEGFSSRWPLVVNDGWYYHSLDRMLRLMATQIGSAPLWIQGEPQVSGKLIATLATPMPDPHSSYPWINHPTPLYAPDKWPTLEDQGDRLMIGDVGCIYFFLDTNGNVEHDVQYH